MRIPAVLAAALLAAGCRAVPEAAPAPASPPGPRRTFPSPPQVYPTDVCVVRDGRLETVEVMYNVSTGDSLVDGRPFRDVHPAGQLPYAEGQAWFASNEPIRVRGRLLMKYGLPRILEAKYLRPVEAYRGTVLFAETEDPIPIVAYVPVSPGCLFQPYQVDYVAGAVRGE